MKKLNLFELEKRFSTRNLPIFTAREIMAVFEVEKRAVDAFLFYNVKKGAVIRLKAGLFTLSRFPASEYAIANRLYMPSYISLDTALSHYNLIPEIVYAITSVTTKATREFDAMNLLFSYRRIKKEAFTGYILEATKGGNVYLATPEKAVADFLYFVYLGKRLYNDRLDWSKIDFSKLEEYLRLFSKKGLVTFAKKKRKPGKEYAG